jgi:hypothetical protein
LLETQVTAQAVLGAAASAFAPVFTLVVMLTLGHAPLLGWGTLWQLLVMTAAGACITPLWFILAEWVQAHLFYERAPHSAFRPDREIHRGRS